MFGRPNCEMHTYDASGALPPLETNDVWQEFPAMKSAATLMLDA